MSLPPCGPGSARVNCYATLLPSSEFPNLWGIHFHSVTTSKKIVFEANSGSYFRFSLTVTGAGVFEIIKESATPSVAAIDCSTVIKVCFWNGFVSLLKTATAFANGLPKTMNI
jgi:hypothetical protein